MRLHRVGGGIVLQVDASRVNENNTEDVLVTQARGSMNSGFPGGVWDVCGVGVGRNYEWKWVMSVALHYVEMPG